MEGKRTINSIKLKNILSFGSEGQEIELQPLNVLIGPNASGKSNFIEVFRLLQALPTNPARVIREGGGVTEWLWKGGEPTPVAEVVLKDNQVGYYLKFSKSGYRWEITEERIESPSGLLLFSREEQEAPEISMLANLKNDTQAKAILKIMASFEANGLAQTLSSIGIYKEWNTGRFSKLKESQRPDLPGSPLWEDLSNFGLIFNNFPSRTKQQITEELKRVYDGVEEVITQINGGTVQTFIQEQGLSSPTPLFRASDGTLRYLTLLTLLKQPSLPSLICIEEPEVGLHPDLIHSIADLLIEASERTQLIVTTHSDVLVSALSRHPETVLVCERFDTGTLLTRLDPDQWKIWLEEYSLGDLWRRGDLGGTRW